MLTGSTTVTNIGGNWNPNTTTWASATTGGNFAYSWDKEYNETLKNVKVKELEQKIKSLVRKKIENIEITSFEDFAFFLTTLLDGLSKLVDEYDGIYLTDNMEFLIDELKKELDEWTETS